MGTRDLPDMYAQSLRAASPRAEDIHIRHITSAHVATNMYHFHMHALIDVILKPTSKSYKSHYINNCAFARALTSDQKIDQRIQINNFPGIHSDVYQCTFRCTPGKLFF